MPAVKQQMQWTLSLHLHPAHGHWVPKPVVRCTLLGIEGCAAAPLRQAVCGVGRLVELAGHSISPCHLQVQRVIARLPARGSKKSGKTWLPSCPGMLVGTVAARLAAIAGTAAVSPAHLYSRKTRRQGGSAEGGMYDAT